MGRKSARNIYSRNTNKIGIQCFCSFYSQGICYDARSYERKKFYCHLLLPYSANIPAYNQEVLALDILVKVMERWLTVTHRTAPILAATY